MTEINRLLAIFTNAQAVLLDFDGPVCSVFSGVSDLAVSIQLRDVLREHGVGVPNAIEELHDPLGVLRFAATADREVLKAVDERFQAAEIMAVALADPTPHAAEFMKAVQNSGKSLAIVSNNSAAAISAYLEHQGLLNLVDSIIGRAYAEPDLMKPHPDSVLRALAALGVKPAEAVLIGDSVTDIEVCQVTGVPCIGYANKPGKASVLDEAGAVAIVEGVDGMGLLTSCLA